jgi:hypothetical protein
MARVLSDGHDVGDEHLDTYHSGGYGIVPFRVVYRGMRKRKTYWGRG